MLAGALEIQMSMGTSQLTKDVADAKRITGSGAEEMARLIGAGYAKGLAKAREAWDAFKEWTKTQLIIWGVALAVGITAAVVGAVYTAFKAVGFAIGLITGSSYKSENIDALAAMNREVKTLQQNLPLTAVGASALNEALKGVGTNASGYAETLGRAATASRANGVELDRLEVKYKDQNGALLTTNQTLKNAAGVLATYADGWDREQAAAAIGMGSEKQIQEALAVTAQKIAIAKDRLVDYGLVIGDGTQEAVTKFEEAMRAFDREAELSSQGIKRAIADNVMPILTDFATFFKDGFPTVVMAFRYSMATVTSLFYGLKTVVFMVAESIVGSISSIGSVLDGLATASMRALRGDFTGAKEALLQGWEDAKTRLGGIGDNIIAQARNNAKAMALAWGADSLGANQAADAVAKVGKAWVAATPKVDEQTRALADNEAAYRHLLKTLKEKLLTDEELNEVSKLALAIAALSEKQLEAITPERKKELEDLARLIDLKKEAKKATEAYIKQMDFERAETQELTEAMAQMAKTRTDAIFGRQKEAEAAADDLKVAQFELTLMTQTDAQRRESIALMKAQLDVERQIRDLGVDLTDIQKESMRNNARKAALDSSNASAIREQISDQRNAEVSMWKSVESAGHQAFLSIFDTSKDVLTRIRDMLKTHLIDILYQMTIKKWIFNIVASVSGAGVATQAIGSVGSGASSMGSAGNLLSGANSAWNTYSSSVGAGVFGSSAAYAAAVPGLTSFGAGSQAAMLAGQTAVFGAEGLAATAASGGAAAGTTGAISALGAAVPYIAAALAIYAAYQYFKGKSTPTASLGNLARNYSSTGQMLGEGTGGNFGDMSAGSIANVELLYSSFNKAAAALGAKYNDVTFAYSANTDTFSGGSKTNYDVRSNIRQTAGGPTTSLFMTGETPYTEAGAQTSMAQAVLTALQGSILPVYVENYLKTLVPASLDATAISNALAFAGGLKAIAESLDETRTPLDVAKDNLAAMFVTMASSADTFKTDFRAALNAGLNPESLAQWQQLAQAMDAVNVAVLQLNAAQRGLVFQFSTDAQKLAMYGEDVTAAFSAMGIGAPTDRAGFRALAAGLDVTTKSGQDMLAQLIAIQPAFDALTQSVADSGDAARVAAELAQAAQDAAENLALQRHEQDIRLMEASGNSAGALAARRIDEIAAMDVSLRAREQYLHSLQDEAIATAAATRAAQEAAEAEAQLAQVRRSWQDQLDILTGVTTQRQIDLARTTDAATRTLMEQVFAQQDLAVAAQEAARAAQEAAQAEAQLAQIRQGWQDRLNILTGVTTQRALDLARTTDAATRSLMEQVFAQEALAAAAAESARAAEQAAAAQAAAAAQIASQRYSLETQLLQAQGNTAELRARELIGIDISNRAIQENIWAIQDKAAADSLAAQAAQAVAAAEAQLAQARRGWQDQLDILTGATTQRQLDLARTTDAATRALMEQVFAQQDMKIAADAAAQATAAAAQAAEQAAAQIASQRYGLETQLLQAQGNTIELRARELLGLDVSNRAIQEQIWAIQDKAAADALATQASQVAAEAAQQAADDQMRAAEQLKNAWLSATESIIDEVNRLRGLMGTTPQSLAQAQAQFAMLTTLARAGDMGAYERLPGLSGSISDMTAATATSSIEVQRARGRLAGSLDTTADIVAAIQGLKVELAAMRKDTKKTADVLTSVTQDGQSVQTTAV